LSVRNEIVGGSTFSTDRLAVASDCLSILQHTQVQGKLVAVNTSELRAGLAVSGTAEFGSSTSVFSASRLQGDVSVFSNAFVSGALSVYGDFELHSSLYVGQFTHLARSLSVFGRIPFVPILSSVAQWRLIPQNGNRVLDLMSLSCICMPEENLF
jgi:hypothetical protein